MCIALAVLIISFIRLYSVYAARLFHPFEFHTSKSCNCKIFVSTVHAVQTTNTAAFISGSGTTGIPYQLLILFLLWQPS